LVSQPSADEPATLISGARLHSSVVGSAERPGMVGCAGGGGGGGADAEAVGAASEAVAVALAVALGGGGGALEAEGFAEADSSSSSDSSSAFFFFFFFDFESSSSSAFSVFFSSPLSLSQATSCEEIPSASSSVNTDRIFMVVPSHRVQ
jgi:hypothetical protein